MLHANPRCSTWETHEVVGAARAAAGLLLAAVREHPRVQRTVLITGASSGIGAATALALAPDWNLVLVARDHERLAAIAAQVTAVGGQAWVVAADLTQPGEPQRVMAQAGQLASRLDALVNNAGVFTTMPVASITAEHLAGLWQLNVQVPMLLTAAAIPHLALHGGAIVNVSSAAAEATFHGCAAYSATKSALETWSRIAREELRAQHIRVGVIAPGATDTAVWPVDSTFDRARMCRPEDVAQAIRLMLHAPRRSSIDRLVVTPSAGPF